jgi:hypothetical protein
MPVDYLHTADDDLLIANGDFVTGESSQQHQSLLLRLKKGELRQYPRTGVGIDNYLLDDNPGDVRQEIQRQFEADGLIVREIVLVPADEENRIEPRVDAYYP